MPDVARFDYVVVGAGLVGLATARALLMRSPSAKLVVLESESGIGRHQSGHNSGVVHSGLYYRPGSAKARLCTEGRLSLERYCAARGVPFERCGKVVVAVAEDELGRLAELERRGRENGLEGLRRLDADELREVEPHVAGVAALWVPQTGIVDFSGVAQALIEDVCELGGSLMTGARLCAARRAGGEWRLETAAGPLRAERWVNCAGLQADRVARLAGVDPGARIVPFRGEYWRLRDGCASWIRNLVYPVPDPRYPFLGVHFTRRIHGGIEAGPNAVLALRREGYRWRDVSLGDVAAMAAWPGFWRMSRRHLSTGVEEVWRSLRKPAFVRALQRLLPRLNAEDVERSGAGVRAQAVARDGSLLDDFHVVQGPGSVHVVNAPSPAATACLAIGEEVGGLVLGARGG